MEFSDLKYLLFCATFLSGIGGYAPPPLKENHPAQNPLAERRGTPTPPLSSFWKVPFKHGAPSFKFYAWRPLMRSNHSLYHQHLRATTNRCHILNANPSPTPRVEPMLRFHRIQKTSWPASRTCQQDCRQWFLTFCLRFSLIWASLGSAFWMKNFRKKKLVVSTGVHRSSGSACV